MQSGSWIDIYRVFRKVSLFSYPEVGICKRKNLRKKERKHAFDQEKKASFKILLFSFFKIPTSALNCHWPANRSRLYTCKLSQEVDSDNKKKLACGTHCISNLIWTCRGLLRGQVWGSQNSFCCTLAWTRCTGNLDGRGRSRRGQKERYYKYANMIPFEAYRGLIWVKF